MRKRPVFVNCYSPAFSGRSIITTRRMRRRKTRKAAPLRSLPRPHPGPLPGTTPTPRYAPVLSSPSYSYELRLFVILATAPEPAGKCKSDANAGPGPHKTQCQPCRGEKGGHPPKTSQMSIADSYNPLIHNRCHQATCKQRLPHAKMQADEAKCTKMHPNEAKMKCKWWRGLLLGKRRGFHSHATLNQSFFLKA